MLHCGVRETRRLRCARLPHTHRVRRQATLSVGNRSTLRQMSWRDPSSLCASVHSQALVNADEEEDEDDAHVLGCPDCHRAHDVTAAAPRTS